MQKIDIHATFKLWQTKNLFLYLFHRSSNSLWATQSVSMLFCSLFTMCVTRLAAPCSLLISMTWVSCPPAHTDPSLRILPICFPLYSDKISLNLHRHHMKQSFQNPGEYGDQCSISLWVPSASSIPKPR